MVGDTSATSSSTAARYAAQQGSPLAVPTSPRAPPLSAAEDILARQRADRRDRAKGSLPIMPNAVDEANRRAVDRQASRERNPAV
jgi:hypothetical protein